MTPRITFLVNGLGLGNSTRCHAVIQRLHDLGCEIDVATSGNGLWYFRNRIEITKLTEIGSFYYASRNGALSIGGTLRAAGHLLDIHKRNDRQLEALFAERKPDVVVADSIYNIRPVRRLGLPLVSLNNADVTCRSFWWLRDKPRSIYPQFLAVETMDYLFQRLLPDLVISPSLDASVAHGGSRFVHVPPIVRKDVEAAVHAQPATRAVIMLSGSVFGMPARLTRSRYPVHIDVVGRDAPRGAAASADVTFHGKMIDTLAILKAADVAVVNGGFSAVSEMFCLRKPMVVVPVPGHAEQWINARTVEMLGLGRLATEETWEESMLDMLDDLPKFRATASRIPHHDPPGAVRAAEAILGVVGRRS